MREKMLAQRAEVKRILCRMIQADQIDDGVDLIKDEVLDSFGIVNLIVELEQHFGVSIPGDKVNAENFSRIDSILRLLEDLQEP
jgi:acyl carrier protein